MYSNVKAQVPEISEIGPQDYLLPAFRDLLICKISKQAWMYFFGWYVPVIYLSQTRWDCMGTQRPEAC